MIEQLDKNELLAMLHKRCTKCGVVKYFGEFKKRSDCAGGVNSRCKACEAESNRKWCKENREKRAEHSRKYYEKNRGNVLESHRKYREENSEKVAESKRKYREKNKERAAELQRKWCEENPEKSAERGRRRRARKANANGTHTAEHIKARFDYYGNKCIYCGSEENLEVEHRIPLSRGGSDWPANLAPACRPCNRSKSTKTEAEFKKFLEERNE